MNLRRFSESAGKDKPSRKPAAPPASRLCVMREVKVHRQKSGQRQSADHTESSPPTLTCALRADGAAIAESASSSEARQYDARTGRPIGTPVNHGDTIGWLAYSPDGTTLLSACAHGTVRVWDAATATALGPPLAHGLPVLGCWFSPDGGWFSVVTVDSQSTSWPVPQCPADLNPASLRHSVEVIAGLRSVEGGGVYDLKLEAWRARRPSLPEQAGARDDESRRVLVRWHAERADNARRSGDMAAYRHHLSRVGTLDRENWRRRRIARPALSKRASRVRPRRTSRWPNRGRSVPTSWPGHGPRPSRIWFFAGPMRPCGSSTGSWRRSRTTGRRTRIVPRCSNG